MLLECTGGRTKIITAEICAIVHYNAARIEIPRIIIRRRISPVVTPAARKRAKDLRRVYHQRSARSVILYFKPYLVAVPDDIAAGYIRSSLIIHLVCPWLQL